MTLTTEQLQQLVFGIVGGLGVFLLGMKNMSDGMQAVAGSSLRRMIGAVTDNRFMATGVGTVVTTLIQSSSITTVMVVGFVNSGVMNLNQAIGVIMGANIGTTITGWFIALKIGKYGLPILGVAAFVYLFSRGDRIRHWALVFLGIGMVFFGMELMKDGCKFIREIEEFQKWFHRFQADTYFGVLKCAGVGCILTMIVQSSSATLVITITLATQGIIDYHTAAALVLGENIGTTVTAYFASLGATTNARRASYFHIIFNLAGVFWITSIFHWYTSLILSLPISGMETRIAATHTIFNVANTLMFLPLVSVMATTLQRLVPASPRKEQPRLTDLDLRMLETPSLAVEQSRNELTTMCDGCRKMLDWLRSVRQSPESAPEHARKIRRRERILDNVQDEVSHFVTSILSGQVPHDVAGECRRQIQLTYDWDAVSGRIAAMLKQHEKLQSAELDFTDGQKEGLFELHDAVTAFVVAISAAIREARPTDADLIVETRGTLKDLIKRLRSVQLQELADREVPPRTTVAFLNTLNAYDRIRQHLKAIAESTAPLT